MQINTKTEKCLFDWLIPATLPEIRKKFDGTVGSQIVSLESLLCSNGKIIEEMLLYVIVVHQGYISQAETYNRVLAGKAHVFHSMHDPRDLAWVVCVHRNIDVHEGVKPLIVTTCRACTRSTNKRYGGRKRRQDIIGRIFS